MARSSTPCSSRAPTASDQHRTVSVAFLQFTGLDDLIAAEGAAAAAHHLDRVVNAVQDACERYDVGFLDSDISSDGAKIRLSAGAPRVVGDDEERMLLALRQIVEAELPLPVKVGVNRGPVFTGEVGPAYRRWYAVMGDTVNLAARVMGKAPLGHVYATKDVLDPVRPGPARTILRTRGHDKTGFVADCLRPLEPQP